MYLFVFASNIQWEMAGPEEYSLVETSEERTLIKSTKLLCKIHKRTMLLSWFMAEKLLSDLAVDGDNVIIRSSSMRQSLTSPGLDAGRFRNTSTRLFAFCCQVWYAVWGTDQGCFPALSQWENVQSTEQGNKFQCDHMPQDSEASILGQRFWTSCKVSPEDFQTLASNKAALVREMCQTVDQACCLDVSVAVGVLFLATDEHSCFLRIPIQKFLVLMFPLELPLF